MGKSCRLYCHGALVAFKELEDLRNLFLAAQFSSVGESRRQKGEGWLGHPWRVRPSTCCLSATRALSACSNWRKVAGISHEPAVILVKRSDKTVVLLPAVSLDKKLRVRMWFIDVKSPPSPTPLFRYPHGRLRQILAHL